MDRQQDDTRAGKEPRLRGRQDEEETFVRLEEIKKLIEVKVALRQRNLNPERSDVGFLRTLDSSIKRNTAVIKKLRQINEEQREGLMDDLRNVNMSKFVSEAVAAICDAKLRTSDIQAAVQVCSLLHQRYEDFSPNLVQGLQRIFFHGKVAEDVDGDKNSKAMKKRCTLKLLLELYAVGVTEDTDVFINIVKDLVNTESLKDRDCTQINLTLLICFARQGRVFLGLPISGQEIQEELFKAFNITADQKKIFKKAFHTYFDAVSELLLSEHASLQRMEYENSKTLCAKGELSDEIASSYEKLRKSYEHLFRNVLSLAEAIDVQPPVMPDDNHTTRITTGEEGFTSARKDPHGVDVLWVDDDTRSFYECLPDLRAFVPAVLLGEPEPNANEQSNFREVKECVLDHKETALNATGTAMSSGTQEEVDVKVAEGGKNKKAKEQVDVQEMMVVAAEKTADEKGEIKKEKAKAFDGSNMDALLQRLPISVRRDLIDQLTVEFCYLNSKSNRKKLVRALFNVPRTSLELLPYYSRLVAALAVYIKDVSLMLLQLLEEEFNFLINKKDQMNIETKIRNIRFIGELCKFRIAPAGLAFNCLKACLDDFSHHNIDVACHLLETCGQFLYRSPETTLRMANLLDVFMRLKNVKHLDPRQSTLVENAYFLCKPPERPRRESKAHPPLHQYIRKLLFSDLDKSSVDHVLRQLRKLPWIDCQAYLLKCFMKVHKGKYGQIHLIASLTAGLSRYHDEFAVAVVDEVLENIRLGLESNDCGMQQRHIAHMRFLGELYNYEQVDSCVIFETLYLILLFGQETTEKEVWDPFEDYFRVRMVITLLETCGQYFDRGSSKRRLDQFLMHFQRYILGKGPLPLDIEFDLQDLLAELRPNAVRYAAVEEANAALLELENAPQWSERHSDTEKTVSGGAPPVSGRGKSRREDVSVTDTDSGGSATPENELPIDEEELEEEDGNGGHGTEEEEEEEEEDDEDDDVAGAGDVDGVRVRQKVAEVDGEEEASFEKDLRAVMQESLEQRRQELRGRSAINMAIPMNFFDGWSKAQHGCEPREEEEEEGAGNEVLVKVLVKRGNKQQVRQMYIPRQSSLAISKKQKEAAEYEEKKDIKRLVLEYNDREEEESGRLSAQKLNWIPITTGRGAARAASSPHPPTAPSATGRGFASRNRYQLYSGGGLYQYHGRRR